MPDGGPGCTSGGNWDNELQAPSNTAPSSATNRAEQAFIFGAWQSGGLAGAEMLPHRRAVVERLARGPASTRELARPFDMALPSFAQHLAMLEQCGMVRSRKEGRVRCFQLAPKPLVAAEGWMAAQHAIWNQRLDRMQDDVEGVKAAKR